MFINYLYPSCLLFKIVNIRLHNRAWYQTQGSRQAVTRLFLNISFYLIYQAQPIKMLSPTWQIVLWRSSEALKTQVPALSVLKTRTEYLVRNLPFTSYFQFNIYLYKSCDLTYLSNVLVILHYVTEGQKLHAPDKLGLFFPKDKKRFCRNTLTILKNSDHWSIV